MTRSEQAKQNFLDGYNCAQSVALAFADLIPMEREALLRAVSPLGGGMSRLRETCGAVTASLFALGAVYGYDRPGDDIAKAETYARAQELALAFEKKNGCLVCRELLGLKEKHSAPVPEARTERYYSSRPCAELIASAAELLEKYLAEHPPEKAEE
ncbi:MAG: C_GCAxxG_C_C family protein [Clostridia bacterium]|nr:C_GCAxxG_C_C family protein [Clostridia bacterium]